MGSFENINNQGSFQGQGSFSNIGSGSLQGSQNNSNIKFEGSLTGNIAENTQEITARITTLIGGILGYDKEARQALVNQFETLATDPTKAVSDFGDAILSTYNLTIDDLGKMPLGEMVGNVLSGAWQHPVDTFFDVMTLGSLAKAKNISKIKSRGKEINDIDVRTRLAENVTNENIKLGTTGETFLKSIEDLEKKFSPDVISRGIEAIEEYGFKRAPKELLPVMQELTKINDTYKMYTKMAGAQLYDDIDFATKELIAKRTRTPFAELDNDQIKSTDIYLKTKEEVINNDIRPLFHLKPEVHVDISDPTSKLMQTDLLKRTYGTIDYIEAANDMLSKAQEFVSKVTGSKITDSIKRVNDKIDQYNKANNSAVKKLQTSGGIISNKFLRELNQELKKTMLSGGTYLGANILTTTLSLLNHFDINAAKRTLANMPRFRKVKLTEADTPLLKYISRINNKINTPIASIDRYLENIASTYASYLPKDQVKYIQSTMPSKTVVTSPALQAMKTLVPFGSYPAAAIQEIGANLTGKPVKSFIYNQIQKLGTPLNQQAQQLAGVKDFDRTKAIRQDENGNQIQRQTIITPIQAANMFLLGQQGDAIQIPIVTFLNKLLSGKGDPNVFEVNGKQYRVVNGKIQTSKGEFNIIPALSYAGRNLLSPVQFYNQVLVPLMSDKYIKDETSMTNKLVSDAQYSSLTKRNQQRVTDKAREKLGKRLLGTYEYKYFDEKPSRAVQRRIIMEQNRRRNLRNIL